MLSLDLDGIKANSKPTVQPRFPENARTSALGVFPATSGNFAASLGNRPQFP
jgi:hypothetical protein